MVMCDNKMSYPSVNDFELANGYIVLYFLANLQPLNCSISINTSYPSFLCIHNILIQFSFHIWTITLFTMKFTFLFINSS
jgi:hypothetical protein